jgi:hypothetical protein
MRTDATIDKRQVRCPNASHIGYSKWKAQVGDLIVWREGDLKRIGRMIGRVHYAPALTGDRAPIRDYILVVGIGDMLQHTFERWVNPRDVERVEKIRDQGEVLAYFLSADLVKAPIDEIRRCMEYGSNTLARYRDVMAKRKQDLEDFNRRHPIGVCQCKLCALKSAKTPEQATTVIEAYLADKGDQGAICARCRLPIENIESATRANDGALFHRECWSNC